MSRHRSKTALRAGIAALIVAAMAGVATMGVAQQGKDARVREPEERSRSGSFEVGGIVVDVRGPNAEAARLGGWRDAQRKGWQQLARQLTGRTSSLSDGALNGIVTGIVVERESIGPNRYVARLGVLFDRARAGAILGVSGQLTRSPPMLVIPLEWAGGTGRVFEQDTAWQSAWERFRAGNSAIDYIRPPGTGADALLLNAGQVGRRGRGWWRTVLDQYGASDVLIPEVRLERSYPGGPVIGNFTAYHGPDSRIITRFALRVDSTDGIDALYDAAIRRIDAAYQAALRSGILKPDQLLAFRPPRPAEEAAPTDATTADTPLATDTEAPAPNAVNIQFDTPGVTAVTATEAAVRGVPGVRSVTTTSLALGGVSVMRVGFEGEISALRAALEARGFSVQEGSGVLRIRRGGGQPTPPQQPEAGNESGG